MQSEDLLDTPLVTVDGSTVTLASAVEVLVLLILAFVVAEVLCRLTVRLLNRSGHVRPPWLKASGMFVRLVVYIAGFELTLRLLGIQMATLFAALGVAALTLGFASRDILGHVLAGIIHRIERSIKVGDVVVIDGQSLTIEHLGPHSVRTRSATGEEVLLPNAMIMHSMIANKSRVKEAYRISAEVGVFHGAERERTRKVLEQAATELDWRLPSKDPVVYLDALDDQAIRYSVNVWIDGFDGARQRESDLREAIWAALDEAGIELAGVNKTILFDSAGPQRGSTPPQQQKP